MKCQITYLKKEQKIMSNQVKNQDPISKEDLFAYMTYVLTGEVKDEKHAKKLRRLARRTTTLSDVTTVFKILSQQHQRLIMSLIDANQIHRIVLEQLGATNEMFENATDEYNKTIKEAEAKLKEQMAKKNKEKQEE